MSFFGDIGSFLGTVGSDIGSVVSGVSSAVGSIPSSLIGSAISGGASLLGGINQQNSAMASVQQQESFQEQERLSAYPDTVTSLENAGLNPVLAVSQGPLSTPAGAMYNPSNILGGAVSSALQGASTVADVANTQAQTASTLATLPNKVLENKPASIIDAILDKIQESLTTGAGSSGISVKDLPFINSAKSGSDAVGSETSDDWLTQLQHSDVYQAISNPRSYNQSHPWQP